MIIHPDEGSRGGKRGKSKLTVSRDKRSCFRRRSPHSSRACEVCLQIFGPLSKGDHCVVKSPGQNLEVPAVFISWIYDEPKTESRGLFDRHP